MDRGHNRETVFHDDVDRGAFLDLVLRYRDRFGFQLFFYCLMGNHFHLLLRLDQPELLSAFLAGLLRAYVHHCHRRHGFVGHRWQGRFKSPGVQDGAYLLSCGRYIERNPVRAGLVQQPWDHAWSSCRAYTHGHVDPLVTLAPEYLETSPDEQRRQHLWREFLIHEDWRERHVQATDWAIGDDGFRLRMRQLAGRPAPRKRGRPRKLASGPSQPATDPNS